MIQRGLACVLIGLAIDLPVNVFAAPNEIKVFTDELANYGEHTLETHVNKASRAGPGAENQIAPLRIMPEYSYGMWRNWEFSLQLPVATTQGKSRLEGLRTELQYVAPHDDDDGWYWGFNAEITRSTRLAEASVTNFEFTPIIGYRIARWHFAANPGIEKAISGASRTTSFQSAVKVAYRAFDKNHFGIEYYVDAGPMRRPLPREEQSRVIYLAWDGKIGESDINVGLGRGTTNASDRWVVKMVYEIAF